MAFRTLVSAETLAAHLDDPSWRIFDCRHDLARPEAGAQAYRAAHIPGAQFLDVDRELSGPRTGKNGRHPLPDPAVLADTLGRRGVTNHAQVVAYDDSGGAFAARLWWLLRWLGHDAAAVLDGGMPAWERAGYALTSEVPRVAPAVFRWRVSENPVGADWVQARLGRPDPVLIDARAPERFRGEAEPIDPVAGHIPGALNRPFKDNLNPDGTFKPARRLHEEFHQLLGDRRHAAKVCYCGSGVTACQNLLALEVAGLDGALLYAGSWSEWCSDPSRPVATGTANGARRPVRT